VTGGARLIAKLATVALLLPNTLAQDTAALVEEIQVLHFGLSPNAGPSSWEPALSSILEDGAEGNEVCS
jgi:hypothetical protein